MSEEFYDDEIAPRLMKICKLCEENGMPFLAVVEYMPKKIGSTHLKTNDECIEMVMIRHCAKTAPNIDGFIIGLSRWAKRKNVDTSSSIVMNLLFKPEPPLPRSTKKDK